MDVNDIEDEDCCKETEMEPITFFDKKFCFTFRNHLLKMILLQMMISPLLIINLMQNLLQTKI